MALTSVRDPRLAPVAPATARQWRLARLIERNLLIYRRAPAPIISGFFEPVFYLFSLGFGIGAMIGQVHTAFGPEKYAAFVGPGLMAAAAMNDSVFDTTYTMFARLKYTRAYDAIIASPVTTWDIVLGETAWIVARTGGYSLAFLCMLVPLGLIPLSHAPAVLAGAMLIGLAFAAAGMAAATLMRDFDDWEFVQLAIVPMCLFSTTLYPLSIYPQWLATFVTCTPLYHGVTLLRDLALGTPGAMDLAHAAYLLAFAAVGIFVARHRLERVLMP